MKDILTPTVFDVLGTVENDVIQHVEGAVGINGLKGSDRISTASENDLVAGDMVGKEWTFYDGEWHYDADAVIVSDYGRTDTFSDTITTGAGNDVLLGNGGNDMLFAGAGNDRANAGRGDDFVFGGYGNDILNLESGDDFAEGGYGNDTINGGSGDDVIYGDLQSENLLDGAGAGAATFEDFADSGTWTMTDTFGDAVISQSAQTIAGETYTISFGLAANLAGGQSTGAVDVMWNGEVIDTVQTTSGAYETFQIDVVSTGSEGELSFKAVESEGDVTYNFDGPIVSYEVEFESGGTSVVVDAFAPGQAKLYQVIDGQLNVFDVESKDYVTVGDQPDFKINSIGFNIEDDLIYGVAKSNGTDSLGNAVGTSDIVMVDASGETYRVGDGFYGDYVGDFDGSGNLWTFQSGIDRVSVVDVDQLDADGNPHIDHYKFPKDLFSDRTYDIAFNDKDGSFYAVVSPGKNGQAGKVVKIDVSGVTEGAMPTFTEIAITGTLYGDEMETGLVKGAFGAVFLDGEGNLYFGLNKGDHDLDASTGTEGAIFQVHADWETGQAYAEFMSEAPTTGSNDGAVDPRAADPFAEIDADAAVLISEPTLTLVDGGNDVLRGGRGDDEIYGNEGDDHINGGANEDLLFGGQGNDKLFGGGGNDVLHGEDGKDKLWGRADDDEMFGGAGNDYLNGGENNDSLFGGEGVDKIVGGTGSDVIEGGAGNDHLWGGSWSGDGSEDTFIFSSGTGKDYVHDFEVDRDIVDLSQFFTDRQSVEDATTDHGWATVIDLQLLDGGQDGDRIVLKSVSADDLSGDNFIF
ncbi:calcium-binding protein [Octadecabacter sp. G9-8]|uniref:Calcium-binding protein n=1 Tax=Octadecabacter dasysiphoniae TaxID=2909341 RepID=A0ABS9CTY1_9RHOB|nr:calcium-binding protein [Octadecabacter dasysiphoniae]MCF2869864.1 calcium-binding protein [Octadecabacter dasysiphoniae]